MNTGLSALKTLDKIISSILKTLVVLHRDCRDPPFRVIIRFTPVHFQIS